MAGLKRTSTGFGGGAPRKKRKANAAVSVGRGRRVANKQILQRTVTSTQRYADTVTLTTGAAQPELTGFHVFRANSVFDPDFAIGGHQPRGFDQLASLYDEYIVTKAVITVRFQNTSTTSSPYGFIAVRPSGVENPDFFNILEGPDRVVSTGAMGRHTVVAPPSDILRMEVDPIKWLGYGSKKDADSLKSNVNSDPVDQILLYVGICDPAVAQATTCEATVMIEYTVLFSQPKTPAMS